MDVCRVSDHEVRLIYKESVGNFTIRQCDVEAVVPSEFLTLICLDASSRFEYKKRLADGKTKLTINLAVGAVHPDGQCKIELSLDETATENHNHFYQFYQLTGESFLHAQVDIQIPEFVTKDIAKPEEIVPMFLSPTEKEKAYKISMTESVYKTLDHLDYNIWISREIPVKAVVTFAVKIDESMVAQIQARLNEDTVYLNRRILENPAFTDAVIVAGDGTEVRCHKNFLIARSPYFQRMFQTEMKEGITSTVTLSEMSAVGVKALIDYIYCSDITQCNKNCELAFELLLAANEYEIAGLEDKIIQLIFYMSDNDWFSISVAVELLHYAGKKVNNEGNRFYEHIMNKVTDVLKIKPMEEIKKCPEFKRLFESPSAGGMDLSLFLMTRK